MGATAERGERDRGEEHWVEASRARFGASWRDSEGGVGSEQDEDALLVADAR